MIMSKKKAHTWFYEANDLVQHGLYNTHSLLAIQEAHNWFYKANDLIQHRLYDTHSLLALLTRGVRARSRGLLVRLSTGLSWPSK